MGEVIYSQTIRQEKYARFFNLQLGDGLPFGQILDIIQDQSGFIWIATDKGLCRYDGINFIHYLPYETDTLSLPHSFVSSLSIDDQNNLYVGTHKGVVVYNRNNETFDKVPSPNSDSFSHDIIRKIIMSGSDTIFAAAVNGVLNRYIISENKTDYYYHSPPQQPYYTYHGLYKDRDGNIWTGGRMTGLHKLDVSNNHWQQIHLHLADGSERQPDVADFFIDSNGNGWLGSINGFYSVDLQNNLLTKLFGSSTFSILENEPGELWLGTGHGLVHFNANKNSFTIYNHDPNDKYSLVNNHINILMKDRQGNMWIGTKNGISAFSKIINHPYHVRLIPGNEESLSHNHVTSLLEEKDGSVWIGTNGGGLNRWHLNENRIDVIRKEGATGKSLISDRVSALAHDKEGYLWIGLWEGRGFNRLNPATLEIEDHRINPSSLRSDWYNDFLNDSEGRFWLGVWGHKGIVNYDRQNRRILPPDLAHIHQPYNQAIHHIINDGVNIWAVTNRNVIYRHCETSDKFTPYWHAAEFDPAFPYPRPSYASEGNYNKFSNTISAAANNGSVVILTDQHLLYRDNNNPDEPFNSIFTNTENSPLSKTHTIIAGEVPETWHAISNEDIYLIDTKNKKLIPFINKKDFPVDIKQISAAVTKGQKLYIFGDNYLFKYDLINHRFFDEPVTFEMTERDKIEKLQAFNENLFIIAGNGLFVPSEENQWEWLGLQGKYQKGLNARRLLSFTTDSLSNSIWLGTENGLYKLIRNKNKADKIVELSGLKNRQILSLAVDKHQKIWAGTDSGLVSVNPLDLSISYHNRTPEDRLACHLITFLKEDKNGNIWAGTTNGGVNKINVKNLSITHFPGNESDISGFKGITARSYKETRDGTIWIGACGLNRFNSTENSFSRYPVPNEFPCDIINSIVEDNNGYLWLAMEYGVVRFNPQNGDFIRVSPEKFGLPLFTTYHTSILHSSGNLIFGGSNGVIRFNPEKLIASNSNFPVNLTEKYIHGQRQKGEIGKNFPIRLKHDENFFSLKISSMSYPMPDEKIFYQLIGIDEVPQPVPKGNEIFYTSIPPGKYVLKLFQGESIPVEFKIIVTPPFWKRWWFQLVLFAFLLGLTFFFLHQYINRIIAEKKAIETEQKLLRSQMNPHFIFNSLSAIQSFIFSNSPMEAGRYLSKFSKLIRLTLQHTRETFIPLQNEIESLQFYLDLQKLRRNNTFEYHIHTNGLETSSIALPPMMVQPFTENCIEHGFTETKSDGRIDITFALLQDNLRIEILDNGIGVNESLRRAKKDKSHESLASIITRERLETFKQKKNNYYLTIKDCSELNIPKHPSGTLVTIMVPITTIEETKSIKGK